MEIESHRGSIFVPPGKHIIKIKNKELHLLIVDLNLKTSCTYCIYLPIWLKIKSRGNNKTLLFLSIGA
jgi:hypothetical protein